MMLNTTIISLGALAILLIIRFTPIWDSVLSSGTYKSVDFGKLKTPKTPNWALVCPEGYCPEAKNHRTAPIFNHSATDLAKKVKEIILSEGNSSVREDNGTRFDLVIRTPVLRWPDLITIEVIELPNNQSSIAIYSRSIYGRSDLGANGKRVKRWLEKLKSS